MTDKIEEQGHKRGCEGRNYACTCGYDDRVEAELSRLRSSNEAKRKALEQIRDVYFEDAKELQYLNAKATIIERLSSIASTALSLQEEEAR